MRYITLVTTLKIDEREYMSAKKRKPRSINRTTAAAIASAAAMTLTALFASPALAQMNDSQYERYEEHFTTEENELLNSDEPTHVTLDPTGEVLSVEERDSESHSLFGTINSCPSGSACWHGWRSPNAYYGFQTLGFTRGNRPNRGQFYTGNYTADHCWQNP